MEVRAHAPCTALRDGTLPPGPSSSACWASLWGSWMRLTRTKCKLFCPDPDVTAKGKKIILDKCVTLTKENKLELCAVPHKFQFLILGVCLQNVARDDVRGCVNLQHLQTLVVCPSATVVQHVATGQENNKRAGILL